MPVQAQVSPAPSGAAFALATFFSLAYVKLQISSHWTRLAFTLRTLASWKLAQNSPASSSSFTTVLKETSHTREIDRIDEPSTSMLRIWTRLAASSLFMPLLWHSYLTISSIIFNLRRR